MQPRLNVREEDIKMLYIENFRSAFSLFQAIKEMELEISELKKQRENEESEKIKEILSGRIDCIEYNVAIASGTLAEVEDFISKCDDPLARQILYSRYLKGNTWEKTAYLTGGYISEECARKIAERYLQKMGVERRKA